MAREVLAQFKAVDARPIKKVGKKTIRTNPHKPENHFSTSLCALNVTTIHAAEAKARKKKREIKAMQKIKKKANHIVAGECFSCN